MADGDATFGRRLLGAVSAEVRATVGWVRSLAVSAGHRTVRSAGGLGRWLAGTDPVALSQRRMAAFLVAVAVLLYAARAAAPRTLFVAALVAFAIASTVWIRGQYAGFVTGTRHDRSVRFIRWAFLAAGLLVLAYFLGGDGLGLPALVLAYFAVGALITHWRSSAAAGVHGIALAALTVVLLVPAALLILVGDGRRQTQVGLLLVALALVVVWPVAVSLLSERLIGAFEQVSDRRVRWLAIAGGLAAYAAVVGLAWTRTSSGPFVVFLLVLGVLTIAVASSTQADIVLIVAVLALLGITPRQTDPPALMTHLDGRHHVLVALGDSYMSGEGASVYFTGTDNAGENSCRRAPTAWAALVGQQPPFDGLAFLACSGAKSANLRWEPSGVRPAQAQQGEPGTQLEQYRALAADHRFQVDLVVISIGGNDAGFSTIGITCLVPGSCGADGLDQEWLDGLRSVDYSLRKTFAEVRATFPDTPVVVAAYPDPIYHATSSPEAESVLEEKKGVRRCGDVALSTKDQQFIATFLAQLNDTVHNAATAYGFHFLQEMQFALAREHLQLCDPLNNGRPGLNFIGLRSVSGVAEQRFNPANWSHNSLHPNERGHAAMSRTFEHWYAAHAPLSPPSAVAEPVRVRAVPTFPDGCDPLDTSDHGCRAIGTAWALERVGDAVFGPRAVYVVASALFVWVAAIAFFGWRRRRYVESAS